jgi:hypothetical protein
VNFVAITLCVASQLVLLLLLSLLLLLLLLLLFRYRLSSKNFGYTLVVSAIKHNYMEEWKQLSKTRVNDSNVYFVLKYDTQFFT